MTLLFNDAFFARDARDVARALLGHQMRRGAVCLRITETEAYWYPDDSANHCRSGRTRRNAPMWGPPGHAYIYLCYGMHWLLNISTNRDGEGAAVLIRAADVVEGHALVAARRSQRDDLAGPGKVTQALALTGESSGQPCFGPDGCLQVLEGERPSVIGVGARIGVGYADPVDRDAPARFGDLGARHLSQRRALVHDPNRRQHADS